MTSTPRPIPPWARTNLKITAAGALGLGFALILLPPTTILHNGLTRFLSTTLLHRPLAPLPTDTTALAQSLALSGVFSYAIGVAYLLAFYHGYEEWFYMGIPAKLAIAGLSLLVWVGAPEKMSPILVVLAAVDGLSALGAGWAVGTFSGRVPVGYRSGRKGE